MVSCGFLLLYEGSAYNLIITVLQFTTVQLKLYSSDAANTLLVNFFKGHNRAFLFHWHERGGLQSVTVMYNIFGRTADNIGHSTSSMDWGL